MKKEEAKEIIEKFALFMEVEIEAESYLFADYESREEYLLKMMEDFLELEKGRK